MIIWCLVCLSLNLLPLRISLRRFLSLLILILLILLICLVSFLFLISLLLLVLLVLIFVNLLAVSRTSSLLSWLSILKLLRGSLLSVSVIILLLWTYRFFSRRTSICVITIFANWCVFFRCVFSRLFLLRICSSRLLLLPFVR